MNTIICECRYKSIYIIDLVAAPLYPYKRFYNTVAATQVGQIYREYGKKKKE